VSTSAEYSCSCHLVANTCYDEYASTKYEVSILNRSIDIEGVQKSPYLLTKFALRMRSITWYISNRWNLIPYLVFPYTRISYSICNFYGAIINHKGCFLFTPMQNDSLIRPIEKWFLGAKKEDLTSWANRPQRNTPTTKTGFWMHWAKIHASQGKLWMHWRNQENKKKHARVQLHPYAHPTQILAATIFCMLDRTVDVITHARFQVNRFWGFGAPGGENDHPPSTWHIALTTVYALTCYTVMHQQY